LLEFEIKKIKSIFSKTVFSIRALDFGLELRDGIFRLPVKAS